MAALFVSNHNCLKSHQNNLFGQNVPHTPPLAKLHPLS